MRIRFIVTAILVLIVTQGARAQTDPIVRARVDQVAKLFSSHPDGIDTLFDGDFLRQVSAAQLAAGVAQMTTAYGAVKNWYYTDSSQAWSAKLRFVLSKGYTLESSIGVEPKDPHLISTLWIGPGTPQIKSYDELNKKLAKLSGKSGYFIGRLIGNTVQPIASLNADTTFALGSAFKLYVLGDLLRDINAHKIAWSDVIRLDSASRSIPSGMMQSWPIGSPLTVQTAASLMISISDNTATDLLIHTLGAGRIENLVRVAGGDADRNRPFLTTQEMFKLKSNDAALGMKYEPLDVEAKRAMLDKDVAKVSRDSIRLSSHPMRINSLEWYASPRQVASILDWIRQNSSQGEGAKVRDILAINPGLRVGKDWKYVGYKGGSEPGVLNLSFLLQSKAGDWYVATGSWNDPEQSLKDDLFEGYMEGAIELIPR